MITIPPHPAPFHPAVLDIAVTELHDLKPGVPGDGLRVLDPFAGIGGIHELRQRHDIGGGSIHTTGVELMPKWAAAHPGTIVRDATNLPASWSMYFDAVVTSPCYGNRMADHHEANDKCSACRGVGWLSGMQEATPCPKCKGTGLSHRRGYRHYYGDTFFDDADRDFNAGAMHFGGAYEVLHAQAWAEVHRVLRPGGLFLLNIKDHIKNDKRVRVSSWHRTTILRLGFEELGRWDIPTSGYGYGENNGARVPFEYVYVFEKP